ncbi:uncharacterized protein LOC143042255 [Mytilus galloprovincialis]|uniref:uncharacterized protein LOC143042255 n=1 Tax=Mytilus galloprovincialis TaxID=29158 RepID=UPI003F7B7B7D
MTDHITQNLSTELYRYMCQSIVGTEDNVKQIRLMNAIRDDLSIHKNEISITSGSYGEGLDMRGSDLDVMYVVQNIKVYDVKPRLNPISAYLLMDTDNVKPGFTQLRLDSRCTSYHNCVQLGDKYYLSSSLWKEDILTKNMDYTIHGLCVSDKDGLYDFAECLHCKSWISSAVQWITRSTNSWPSNNVKQSIIKHGVLFVPIRTKGSTKEDLEWRISFSISEKMLVHTFTHTQLCCYALIKILLKDVIATDSVKNCSALISSKQLFSGSLKNYHYPHGNLTNLYLVLCNVLTDSFIALCIQFLRITSFQRTICLRIKLRAVLVKHVKYF